MRGSGLSISLLLILLLSLVPALAAEVTEEGGGITRGSIAYTFAYNPDDVEPTVITGIRQSDIISIITGHTDTGVREKFELYFKSRIGDEWGYEVIKGERGLRIALGGTRDFDVDKDGVDDLTMEFTAVDPVARATITFYPIGAVPSAEEGTGEGAETNETTVNESVEQVPPDEQALPDEPAQPPEEVTIEPEEAPAENIVADGGVSLLPIIVCVVLLAGICALIVYMVGQKHI